MSFGAINGVVVDATNKPIPWALVSIDDVNSRFSWAYSDSLGKFCLDPLFEYPKSNCTVTPIKSQAASQSSNLKFTGKSLSFGLPTAAEASLALYNVGGQEVFSSNLGKLSAGSYNLALNKRQGKGSGVFVATLKVGKQSSSVKIFADPAELSQLSARWVGQVKNESLAKNLAAAAAYKVRIGRTGYTAQVLNAPDANAALNTVVLAKYDVEGKVAAIMSSLSDNAIKAQLLQADGFKHTAAVVDEKMGTALVAGDSWPGMNDQAPHTVWRDSLTKLYDKVTAATEKNLPPLISADLVHGVNMVSKVTITPHHVGLGATFDTNIVEKVYRMVSFEAAGLGFNWALGPSIAVPRHLFWGRTYEGFGETPELTRWMSKASVVGMQSTDMSHPWTIVGCAKHFLGDGGTEGGHDRGFTKGAEAELLRIHWPGYEEAIKWDIASIMTSFSVWAPEGKTPLAMKLSPSMQKDQLRTKGGFTGFMQGDYVDHEVNNVSVYPEAVAAGFGIALLDPTKANDISNHKNVINSSWGARQADYKKIVTELTRVKAKMGLLEGNRKTATQPLLAEVGGALNRSVAREAVRKSMVLLKNQGNVLPLKATDKVHLAGSHSNSISLQCGGWTITWQGLIHRDASFDIGGTTVKKGFETLGGTNVTSGTGDNLGNAAGADKIVVVVGEWPTAEWYGDVNADRTGIDDQKNWHDDPKEKSYSWNYAPPLKLYDGTKSTPNQKKLVADAAATGKPVVCVLMVGRPIDISEQLTQCSAIVSAWLPGTEGDGIAEVLYAKNGYDFTGMLPHSWPTSKAQEPINFGDGKVPQFNYGWGLNMKGETLWSKDVKRL